MICNSVDVATQVTPTMSALIERLVNDPDRTEAPTLGAMREFVAGLLPSVPFEAATGDLSGGVGWRVDVAVRRGVDRFDRVHHRRWSGTCRVRPRTSVTRQPGAEMLDVRDPLPSRHKGRRGDQVS